MAGDKKTWWIRPLRTWLLALVVVATVIGHMVPVAHAADDAKYTWKDAKTIAVAGWDYNPSGSGWPRNFDMGCVKSGQNYQCTYIGTEFPADARPTAVITNTTTGKITHYSTNVGSPGYVSYVEDMTIGDTDKAPSDLTAGPSGDADDVVDPELACGKSFSLTWLICPQIHAINGIVASLDDFINSLLIVDTNKIFSLDTKSGQNYYNAWKSFEYLALGLIVVAGLIMVIAQAFGFELLDAYTIKKIMPRLLIAVIAIALSWQLLSFFVNFTNDVGLGIRQLIYSPFKDMQNSLVLGGGASFIAIILASTSILALGIMGMLSFGLTALLAVFVAFLVLMVRQLVVVALILFAPIAIACSILPNTQGAYKLWYESFTKAMMMFPIIVAFIAIGRVFALVSIGSNLGAAPAVSQLMGFAAYFLPYFLIPLTFSLAGGAMRFLGGQINDRNRGGFDRLKKYRQGAYARHGGRRLERGGERMLQARYRTYKGLQTAGSDQNRSAAGRVLARLGARTVGGFNIEEDVAANNEKNSKRRAGTTGNGPDNLTRAYTVNKGLADNLRSQWTAGQTSDDYSRINSNGQLEYQTLGGSWQSEADVLQSRRANGANNHAFFQSALQYEMGKATTQEQQDNLIGKYGAAAQSFGLTQNEANEVWIGASYAEQNTNRQWKHHSWSGDSQKGFQAKVKGLAMMREIDEKQGNYQMSMQNADTWTTMSQEMMKARDVVDGKTVLSRSQGQTDAQYTAAVQAHRKDAAETLTRGARIAHATAAASMANTNELDGDNKPTGQVVTGGSGREVGAGAPGRVMEEMNSFVQIAQNAAGDEFRYRPTNMDIPKPQPTTTPPPSPEGSTNRRDPNRQ